MSPNCAPHRHRVLACHIDSLGFPLGTRLKSILAEEVEAKSS
jgi:hypothetical protein